MRCQQALLRQRERVFYKGVIARAPLQQQGHSREASRMLPKDAQKSKGRTSWDGMNLLDVLYQQSEEVSEHSLHEHFILTLKIDILKRKHSRVSSG